MAVSFPRFSWLWLGGKDKEQISNGSLPNSINSLPEWGLGIGGESNKMNLYSDKNSKRKWKSREERNRNKDGNRMIDKEYDVVLVPSDGVCLSGSESDDSDWSIGWMEPHGPGFDSDDEFDDSFAVLVPCYRHELMQGKEEDPRDVKKLPNDCLAGISEYMGQWLNSLPKY